MLLKAGEKKRIVLTLSPEEFYIFNETTNSYQVPEGEFMVQVGGSSDNLPLKANFTLSHSIAMPDLSVKNIRTIPVFPKEGEPVMFLASLINNGTGATQIGDNHLIRFYVEGKEVAHYYSNTAAIPVGGMVQICAQSTNNTNWIAQKGTF